NSLGMRLALIPAGEFDRGVNPNDLDPTLPKGDQDRLKNTAAPQHRVRLTRPFYMGMTEVTFAQFRAFVNDTSFQTWAEKTGKGALGWDSILKRFDENPKFTWRIPGFEVTDEHPVTCVSWSDAARSEEHTTELQ